MTLLAKRLRKVRLDRGLTHYRGIRLLKELTRGVEGSASGGNERGQKRCPESCHASHEKRIELNGTEAIQRATEEAPSP